MLEADLFRNDKPYLYGVSYRDERGEMVGQALRPGDEIYLTKDQQRQVARAPRRADDNPFTNGTLVLVAAGADVDAARPIGSGLVSESASVPPAAPEKAPASGTVPEDVVGVETREYLESLKRNALDAKARKLGVKKPDQMGNKGEVIDAILAAQG